MCAGRDHGQCGGRLGEGWAWWSRDPSTSYAVSQAKPHTPLRMTDLGGVAEFFERMVSMGQTIVEKIAQAHLAEGPKRSLRTGDFVTIRPHRVMTHDNTSAVIKKFQSIGAKKIQNPKQLVFALDHDIQNKEEANLQKYQAIEGFAKHHGVDFYPAGSGIGHQIMVERGYVLPASFVVASDSHSNM